ncbi:MarR family winged helix-turn-helix transcriptional regulator [Candidatus Oscillochloris fontis]|uniref:MarR family winged helix-turn-helix transcriptional regulator n=1 Tax=Candidatus Oscillochloris fontis TaxID=2496868 RepID=UPI00101C08E0|nr:MarR family transcriptional regulator [Candidatus Oscillochloris fontis]
MSAEAASIAQMLLDMLPLLNRAVLTTIQVDEPDALTMPQFRVLAHLSDGPKTVSELARRRRVTLASMGQLAQALVERGLVERRPDPQDRRQYQLSLSLAGQERYAATYALALRQLATLLAERLSSSDLATLQTTLPLLHHALADQ